MIVTRQRRKPFPWKRLVLPLVAIALVAFALWWTPSRNVIANGPTAPLWRAANGALGGVTAPFHFAAQTKTIGDKDKQIAQLQSQVGDLQSKNQAKDKQISSLQSQLTQLQTQAAAAGAVKPAPLASASASPFGGASSGASATGDGDLSAGATVDMKRTAQYWANMEPENAAKVVQKLPVVYVAHVFAQMAPDSASSIMDALPANYVAALTQEHPELKR